MAVPRDPAPQSASAALPLLGPAGFGYRYLLPSLLGSLDVRARPPAAHGGVLVHRRGPPLDERALAVPVPALWKLARGRARGRDRIALTAAIRHRQRVVGLDPRARGGKPTGDAGLRADGVRPVSAARPQRAR